MVLVNLLALAPATGAGAAPAERPASLSTIEGWREHDPRPALDALARQCALQPPRAGSARWLADICPELPHASDAAAARAFFETFFRAVPMGADGTGFLTAYYEPELPAAAEPDGTFRFPLRAPPPDLARLDPDDYPAELPAGLTHARRLPDGRHAPVPDRAAIEAGALDDLAPPIAFLADPVEAFFVHVQGSARLRMADGTVRRVGYAGKSGHPYTAIGAVLVEHDLLTREEVTADAIRAVLRRHPARAHEIMNRNRSYVFFRDKPAGDPSLGPRAAAGVQLTPRASVAVDRAHVPWGTPVFLAGTLPIADADRPAPFATLAIAQDTGSAIVGPARADLFLGSGPVAGLAAGRVKHRVAMYRLVPRGLPADVGEADARR